MAQRTVTLCDFCEKSVAVDTCCVCSQDGCGRCLGDRLTLSMSTSNESLSAVVRNFRKGQTVQEDPHVQVVREEARSLCLNCRNHIWPFLKGDTIGDMLKANFKAFMGRAKAVWAVKAMTGKNINDDNDEVSDDDDDHFGTLRPGGT